MKVVVFTDGGARPNPGPSGAGFYAIDDAEQCHVWWKSFVSTSTTNNTAELEAGVGAFKYAIQNDWKEVLIRPDSQYLIGTLKSRKQNQASDFMRGPGDPVPNAELIKVLYEQCEAFMAKGGKYATQWVKGHSGHKENEIADQMATRGVIAAQKGVDVEEYFTVPVKKYDKFPSAKYDRLFDTSHCYFNTPKLKTESGLHVYLTGHHGKDDTDAIDKDKVDTSFGKAIQEAVISILFMKEPHEVLDKTIKEQLKLCPNNYSLPYILSLSQLHSPKTFNEASTYDCLYMHMKSEYHKKNQKIMCDSYGNRVSRLHSPPKLGMLAMANMEDRAAEFEEYLNGNLGNFTVTDVTDKIFVTETKQLKKKTVEELVVEPTLLTKSVTTVSAGYASRAGVDYVDVRLNIAHELFTTNGMRSLRKDNPKVKILTWPRGDLGVCYAVHFETDNGHAFRMPTHSNLIFIDPEPQTLKQRKSSRKKKK